MADSSKKAAMKHSGRTLGVQRGLAGLVLRDLVHLVLAAGLALAERPLVLRDVHLWESSNTKAYYCVCSLLLLKFRCETCRAHANMMPAADERACSAHTKTQLQLLAAYVSEAHTYSLPPCCSASHCAQERHTKAADWHIVVVRPRTPAPGKLSLHVYR